MTPLPQTGISFCVALNMLKSGARVARSGWNGKGMFIFLVPGSTFAVSRPPLLGIYKEGTIINYHPHIDMRMADGRIMPWTPSQADLLTDDWVSVNDPPGNVEAAALSAKVLSSK
jgi:Protein of unknown function (DUF2829)